MIGRVLRKRLHRPEALGLLARDCWGQRGPVLSNQRHLEEAAQWLLRAQAATPDAGVSAAYSFEDGWAASYPETTGYIIPTLLRYADYCGNAEYRTQALAMAEWELTVQLSCGGFPGHFVDRSHPPVVFNTGQVIFGLVAAAAASGEDRFLRAAERAGAWLMRVQDADGAWRSFDFGGHVHAYNTRTAWALIELATATRAEAPAAAAIRHLEWVLRHTQPNGWFQYAAFEPTKDPLLHTIAYTAQGLLEAGMKLGRLNYVEAAERAARQLLGQVRVDGFIPATFDSAWRPTARYSCLTGNAQMSIVWLRLFARSGDSEFRNAAVCANRFLKSVQDCETSNPHIRGAMKGSHPLWGRYLFGTYPNWAAKFFMDAVLMEEALLTGRPENLLPW
jgi:hypothetical protein